MVLLFSQNAGEGVLECLKYGFLPGILQPGFPATSSATGRGNFQPVAVNRAVSSHVGRGNRLS